MSRGQATRCLVVIVSMAVGKWPWNACVVSLLAVTSADVGCGLGLAGLAVGGSDGGDGDRRDDASAIDDRTVAADIDAPATADSPGESPTDSAADAPPPDAPPPPIAFVQVAATTPQTAMADVSVTYTMAQTAGDFDVVVVGWNDTVARVMSIGDSSANVYSLAVGPTTASNQLSQSIYYSPNIRAATAGGNTVHVTFGAAANFVDVRIVEYRGIAMVNPLDQTSQSNGMTAAASTPAVTTTDSHELIFAAGMTTGTFQPAAAPFVQRIITMPDGDTVEDEIVTSLGSYGATAQQNGAWIMQLATFRSAP
jgi:hypothetical protein